eukprot:TRINITY_DN18058_c0_g1_i2.p1 TRINITY_DN18058_c0_g1~~TRINITY_DN18058_c0_g1_i2.p1  ORF type:complete len:204 (-),score=-14.73 TRINITY_DN18058_c0_g1_i2:114-701(-)
MISDSVVAISTINFYNQLGVQKQFLLLINTSNQYTPNKPLALQLQLPVYIVSDNHKHNTSLVNVNVVYFWQSFMGIIVTTIISNILQQRKATSVAKFIGPIFKKIKYQNQRQKLKTNQRNILAILYELSQSPQTDSKIRDQSKAIIPPGIHIGSKVVAKLTPIKCCSFDKIYSIKHSKKIPTLVDCINPCQVTKI